MDEQMKQVILPLGIGLTSVGVVFGLTNSPFFFFLSAVGLVFIILSALKNRSNNEK